MSNLQKFNKTLEELDLEVNRLNAVSNAYEKLEDLLKTYENIVSVLKENNKDFIELNKTQEDHNTSISNSIDRIKDAIKSLENEFTVLIEKKTDIIRKENKSFYHDFEKTVYLKLSDNKSEIKQLIENERNQIKQIIEGESNKICDFIKLMHSEQTETRRKEIKTIEKMLWGMGVILVVIISIICYQVFA